MNRDVQQSFATQPWGSTLCDRLRTTAVTG